MSTGGNEIKFKWDPSASEDGGPQTINKPEETTKPEAKEASEAIEPTTQEKPNTAETAPDVKEAKAPTEAKTPTEVQSETKEESSDVSTKDTTLTDDQFLNYWNTKNGTTYSSLDEVNQVKEVEKIVEKEAELPEHLKGYMAYFKDTGRSLEDFAKLNADLSKIPNIDLAREAIRIENKGLELSASDVEILLAEKMGVDPEDLDDLNDREKIKLKAYANKHLQQLVEDQKKYKQPLETKADQTATETSTSAGEMVTLTNGQTVTKASYDKQRKDYIEARTKAVESLDGFTVDLVVDNNGEKVNIPFKYDYSEEDRGSMLTYTEDVNTILPSYNRADGSFDHSAFNEDQWWSKKANREKAMIALLTNARSIGVDEVLKEKRNINFDQKQKPTQQPKVAEGYANGRLDEIRNSTSGYGVKFGIPNN